MAVNARGHIAVSDMHSHKIQVIRVSKGLGVQTNKLDFGMGKIVIKQGTCTRTMQL